TSRGRTMKTTSLRGFLSLYLVAALRPWRRRSLRYFAEQESIDSWLGLIEQTIPQNYDLAVEAARMRGLVKGYGDTHARGRDKFDLPTAQLPLLLNRRNGVALFIDMYRAALVDENGDALRQFIDGLPS